VPRHAETIRVDAGAKPVEAACREALPALGWETTSEAPGRIEAREDVALLSCRTSPSQVEISLEPDGVRRTVVTIAAKAPGMGPIPGPKRLRVQVAALQRRIREAAGS
jgi:hypothetical protein